MVYYLLGIQINQLEQSFLTDWTYRQTYSDTDISRCITLALSPVARFWQLLHQSRCTCSKGHSSTYAYAFLRHSAFVTSLGGPAVASQRTAIQHDVGKSMRFLRHYV